MLFSYINQMNNADSALVLLLLRGGACTISLRHLAAHCARLDHLILSWCTRITDRGACAVARRCPLSVLSVHGVLGVGEPLLSALEAGCASTIVALDVRGCKHLSRREPEAIHEVLPRVTTFVLAK